MRIRLRYKLLVFSGLLAMIPIGVAGWTMIRSTQDELISAANEEIIQVPQLLSKDISVTFENSWLGPLRLASSNVDNPELAGSDVLDLLTSYLPNISDVVAFQLSTPEGGQAELMPLDSYQKKLVDSGADADAVLRLSNEELLALEPPEGQDLKPGTPKKVPEINDWLLPVVIRLDKISSMYETKVLLSAQISLKRVAQDMIEEHPLRKRGGKISVIDIKPGTDNEARVLFGDDLGQASIVDETISTLPGEIPAAKAYPYTKSSGEKMLGAFSEPQYFQWGIIAELDESLAYAAVNKMRKNLLFWMLIGVAAGGVGGLLFAGGISRPVEKLARSAREVGEGNLDIDVPKISSRDEIGDLGKEMTDMVAGLKDRDFIRDTFGRYVSPEVAQQVLSDPSALHPGGEVRTVTIMFSDLRGFTSLSEQLTPAEMVELLNAYLGRMSDVIAKHDGTVIEFIGDAIMALFGAPTPHDDDPLRAVACAAEMHIELEKFNEEYSERGVPPLEQGVGINTGAVIVGNIGSEKRMKYGVVGDDVNLAARAESFTVGGEVLVAETTRNSCGDDATFRGPIEVKAKGKKEALRLFAVVSVGAGYDLDVPAEHRAEEEMADVDIEIDVYTLKGKQVSEEAETGSIVKLGENVAEMMSPVALSALTNLKLRLKPQGQDVIEEVYAKVISSEADGGQHRCQIRITSVQEKDRDRMTKLAAT